VIVRIGREYRKTILLSSHLLADVEEVCGRVTILYGGRAQVTGSMDEILARRDRLQITCDRLPPEAVAEIERIVRSRGGSVEVSTPRDRLESLFLRIVREASAQRLETAGSTPAGQIAGFLGEQARDRGVLESLLAPAVAPQEPEPVTVAAADEADSSILAELSGAASPPGDGAEPPGASPPDMVEPDRRVIEELTGEAGTKDAR